MERNPKRDRILDQTRKEFLEVGYSGFTMDDISTKTGISKATIYKYFPGKHDLIKGLVKDMLDEDARKQQEILDSDKSFVLATFEILKFSKEKLSFFRPHVLKDLERNAPDIMELIHQSREERMPGFISTLLRRGQKDQQIKEHVDPDLFAFALLVIVREFSKPDTMDRFSLDVQGISDFIFHTILAGSFTKTGEKELNRLLKGEG